MFTKENKEKKPKTDSKKSKPVSADSICKCKITTYFRVTVSIVEIFFDIAYRWIRNLRFEIY